MEIYDINKSNPIQFKELKITRGGILHDVASARPELFSDENIKSGKLLEVVDAIASGVTFADVPVKAEGKTDVEKAPF